MNDILRTENCCQIERLVENFPYFSSADMHAAFHFLSQSPEVDFSLHSSRRKFVLCQQKKVLDILGHDLCPQDS
jgi:hypothetical protein